MQTPTIGRIVIFTPAEYDREAQWNGADALPAIVTRVRDNGYVNLQVFSDGQGVLWRTSVPYVDDAQPRAASWEWPVIVRQDAAVKS